MDRRTLQIFSWSAAIVLVGAGAAWWFGWQPGPATYKSFEEFLRGRPATPEAVERYAKYLERAYREDSYGGATPRETLDLFIAALEKGDIELAAKYFVLGKQDEVYDQLLVGKEKGNLEKFLAALNNSFDGKEIYKGTYQFTVVREGEALLTLVLDKNEYSGLWKLREL